MARRTTTKDKELGGEVEKKVEDTSAKDTAEMADKKSDEQESVSIDVVNGNLYVRTYSKEVHGDEFMDLAKQFCQKKPQGRGAYSLVPSESIKKVEVRYREKADAELPLDKQKPDAPMEDKVRVFDDKDKALSFRVSKFGSTVVISKKK